MRGVFSNPLFVVLVAIVIVALAVGGGATSLKFQPDILSKALPSLLAGLLAIAAFTERATAVIGDIWLGEEHAQAEDAARLTNRKVQSETAKAVATQALAVEALRTNNTQFFTANATVLSATAPVTAMAAEIKQNDDALISVQRKETRARLSISFIVGLLVSAVGVRALQSLLDADKLTDSQRMVFHGVDILLTAGVLTGGTSGISAISELLGTYVSASRKRALE